MIANTPMRVSASASFGRSNLQPEDGVAVVGERGSGGAGSVAGSAWRRAGERRASTHPAFGPPSPSSPNMADSSRLLPLCACDRPDILSRLCDDAFAPLAAPAPGAGP